MRVAYDSNGYSYDIDTGYYVNLAYDDAGNAYDAETGEHVDEVILDAGGTTVYTGSGGINWNQVITTAAQAYAAGQGAAQSGQYIPQGQPTYPYPSGGGPVYGGVSGGATVTGGVSSGGVSGGLKISTNTLLIGGLVLAAFIFGQRRR